MADPILVELDGTRVNDADTGGTPWGNWTNSGGSAGGAAVSAEPQLAYQGTNAVNKKVTATTDREGVDIDPFGASVDVTTANNALFFFKLNVTDSFDLNSTWGVQIDIGNLDTQVYQYNVSGSGAKRPIFESYVAQSGYLIGQINPTVAEWRDGTVGTVTETAIDFLAFGMQTINGATKDVNFAVDSVDFGRGLRCRGGGLDGASTGLISFGDFLSSDQETRANRWGVVTGSGNSLQARGMLAIGHESGGGVAQSNTRFQDTESIITFLDGYHASNNVGVIVYNANTNDSVTISSLFIGGGANTENAVPSSRDTRPDFTVVGTANTVGVNLTSATFRNFRNINLNSSVTVDGCTFTCEKLKPGNVTVGNCSITDTSIFTTGPAANATVELFPDNNSNIINNTNFFQDGLGHAVELATVGGTYNFDNLSFTDYNASNNQNDSALWVSAGSGTTTINLNNGSAQPSFRTAGATVTFVSSVSVTVTNMIANTELRIYNTALSESDANYQIAGVEDVSKATGDTSEENGTASGPDGNGRYSFNFSTSQNVNLKLRFINTAFVDSAYWIADDISVNSGTDATLSIQAAQRRDRVFSNPV